VTPSLKRQCAATCLDVIPVRQNSLSYRRLLGYLALAGGVLLNACATRPPVTGPAPESAWLQHRASLEALSDWQARGRVAIRRDDDGWNAGFDWQQSGDSYRIRLRGPFGQGGIELHGDRAGVWLQRENEAPVYARSVDRLLQDETGWRLPVQGLRDWLLGLPVAEQSSVLDWDGQGRLHSLQQDGWSIDYRRYRGVGEQQLPEKLQLQRDQVQVRVVVDEWQLP